MGRYVPQTHVFQVLQIRLVSPPSRTQLTSSPRPFFLSRPYTRHLPLFRIRLCLIRTTKPHNHNFRLHIHSRSPVFASDILVKELSRPNLRGVDVGGIPRLVVWPHQSWNGGMGEYTQSRGIEESATEI